MMEIRGQGPDTIIVAKGAGRIMLALGLDPEFLKLNV
jgi:hypothetical protein